MDCLFALAPLLWLSRREVDPRIVRRRWFQSGAFFWLATLSWMPAIVKNGGPWPLVVLGWFALAAYCSLYFAAYGWLCANYWNWARGRYVRRLAGVLLVEPVLWCGLELVRSRFLGGFAWNQLGVVPVNGGFGAPAALGGVYLCSAAVILVNGTIAGIAERLWKPERSGFVHLKRFGPVETFLAFALVFALYLLSPSPASLRSPSDDSRSSALKVALVQRNFPCVFREQEENPYEAYGRLLDNVAVLRPDLVVLSESALCEFGPVDSPQAHGFVRWVAERTGGAALLAGGSRSGSNGLSYNSAALYAPATDSPRQVYDKVHLVPFGEFIPGDKLFPFLQKFAPVGSCTPGESRTLSLQPQSLSLGVAICYEDTDSAQMRDLAKRGARVLFFVTNDSWFSQSVEAEQHAWQAVARAIETGLPVVRVGNSGVTGTILPDGKATWLIGSDGKPLVDRSGTMFDRIDVSRPSSVTPYVRLGDWPLGIAFAILLVAMYAVRIRARSNFHPKFGKGTAILQPV